MNVRPRRLEHMIDDHRHSMALPDLADEEGQPREPQQGENRRSDKPSQKCHEYSMTDCLLLRRGDRF